ncbi:type III secretion system effector XopAV [Xanthomonas graminis]|uniref:type III secretion system effector XopAV n=1 Tax=Xanthomonas graminis TaxID=3390026 RepID=UPI001E40CA3B|nr:type III secretion system effector XopAV [Xanthomonas translucens]
MQPAALPRVSSSARREEIDLESGLARTERNGAPSSQRTEAQIDARLQDLPRQPARTAPLRAPPASTRQRIAGRVAGVADATATVIGIASITTPAAGFVSYISGNQRIAEYSGIAFLAGAATTGTLAAIKRLASTYAYGNNLPGRASALGISQATLRTAVDLVTVPEEDERDALPMNDAERNALALDLMHLATMDHSRLDPGLWNAAHSAGDNADALIEALRAFRRPTAQESHAAASSSA